MNFIECLIDDHQTIKQKLQELVQLCKTITPEKTVMLRDHFNQRLRQLKIAEVDHHIWKEENLLFPELVKLGVSIKHGPIEILLKEHKRIGRLFDRFITTPPETVDNTLIAAFLHEKIRELAMLIAAHAEKEEWVLFQVAHSQLSPRSLKRLKEKSTERLTCKAPS